ncbi:hypothetical protein GBAR_LOCUS29836, partial [Geodia barretti]
EDVPQVSGGEFQVRSATGLNLIESRLVEDTLPARSEGYGFGTVKRRAVKTKYANMRKMLLTKNDQIKELRSQLKKYES